MIFDVVKYIAECIDLANAGFFVKYFHNCIKVENRILSGFQQEKIDSGISDYIGKGFYIRYSGKVGMQESKKQVSSKNNTQRITIPLRLVAYHISANPVNELVLAEKLKSDFLGINFNNYTGKNEYLFDLTINSFEFIPSEIIKEETDKTTEDLKIYQNSSIVAFDFVISFDAKENPCLNLCDELKPC